MAVRALGTKLSIEGEKEYKKALSEVNADLKVLGSQMKTATAQFKDNATSVEALSAKQEILSKKLEAQKSKVDIAREALAKASATYGEADQRTKNWQISLNNAQAELYELDRELAANREALDLASREMDDAANAANKTQSMWEKLRGKFQKTEDDAQGLGDSVNELAGKFGVNLPDGVSKALNGLGKINPTTVAAAAGIGALVTGAISLGKQVGQLTIESAAFADEILTMSTVTGISTEKLQEYTYAAELMDVSVETITGSMTKLIRNMGSARDGTAAQVEAFDKLGVSYQNADGTLRDAEAVFSDIIDALGTMTNETERDAVAMDLLGKSAQDLNPLIAAGSEAMNELAREAHATGAILDEDALSALGRVDDGMQRFKNAVDATKNKLAAEFAPTVAEAMEASSDWVLEFGDAIEASGASVAFREILEAVGLLSDEGVPELDKSLRPLTQTLAAIADLIEVIKAGFYAPRAMLDMLSGNVNSEYIKYAESAAQHLGLLESQGKYSHQQELQQEWESIDAEHAKKAAAEAYKSSLSTSVHDILYGTEEEANKGVKELIGSTSIDLVNKLKSMYYEGLEAGYAPYRDMTLDEFINKYYDQYAQKYGYNAGGTSSWRGGWSWVGENGPELAYLPRGSAVVTAQESQLAGGDTYYITIDAKSVQEFNDIVRIAKAQRRTDRMYEG